MSPLYKKYPFRLLAKKFAFLLFSVFVSSQKKALTESLTSTSQRSNIVFSNTPISILSVVSHKCNTRDSLIAFPFSGDSLNTLSIRSLKILFHNLLASDHFSKLDIFVSILKKVFTRLGVFSKFILLTSVSKKSDIS